MEPSSGVLELCKDLTLLLSKSSQDQETTMLWDTLYTKYYIQNYKGFGHIFKCFTCLSKEDLAKTLEAFLDKDIVFGGSGYSSGQQEPIYNPSLDNLEDKDNKEADQVEKVFDEYKSIPKDIHSVVMPYMDFTFDYPSIQSLRDDYAVYILAYGLLSNAFLQRFPPREAFPYICLNENVPSWYWGQHRHLIDWDWLSGNPGIPLQFLNDRRIPLSRSSISSNPSIPIEFLEEHIHFITPRVSANTSITLDFLERHPEKQEFYFLATNPAIPEQFIYDNLETLDFNSAVATLQRLSYNPNTSEDYFRRVFAGQGMFGHLQVEDIANRREGITFSVARLSTEFCEEFIDRIDFKSLGNNNYIPTEFFATHMDRFLNSRSSLQSSSITSELVEQYLNRPEIMNVCSNPHLPIEFIEEHIDDFPIQILVQNPSLPLSFWVRHIDRIQAQHQWNRLHYSNINIRQFLLPLRPDFRRPRNLLNYPLYRYMGDFYTPPSWVQSILEKLHRQEINE